MTHRKTSYKLSTKINHGQREPQTTEEKPVTAAAEDGTLIETKVGENINEIPFKIFDPNEKIYYDLTGKFPVQ